MIRELLHRPIGVTMVILAMVVMGILATGKMPVSLMPDVDIPYIVVQIQADGMSAHETEERMVRPLRQQLSQMAGIESVKSETRSGMGLLTLRFPVGSDMSLQFIEVNEKIDRTMATLPKGAERPRVMKMSATDLPAFYVNISGGKTVHTSRLIRNVIAKRIEQLPQVAMTDYSGTVGTQVTIIPDEEKMAAIGLTDEHIERAVKENNIMLEALSIRDGIYRYNIHFDSQIISATDIENIYLRTDKRLIQLKDICKVEETAQQRCGIVTANGKDAITMAVIKQSDARMTDLQQSMDTLITELRADYPELTFDVTRDQTQLLAYSIHNLELNLAIGIIMACMVLFFFIGGWRVPMLVVISIPLSLILTLLCFHLLGMSLNIISLSGLILGVGMIVDNAIIVVDNLRQRNSITDKETANATKEVFMPMLASVLTTCSVFIPLVFLSGMAGALFYDQAVGVTVSLFCSLIIAAIIVPVYYYRFARKANSVQKEYKYHLFHKINSYTLRHQRQVIIGCATLTLLAITVYPFIKKERIPELPYSDSLLYIDWNSELTPEENSRRTQEALNAAGKHIQTSTVMAGNQDFMLPHTKNTTSGEAICYIKSEDEQDIETAMNQTERYIRLHYPKAKTARMPAANIFDMIFATDEPTLRIALRHAGGRQPAMAEVKAMSDSLHALFPDISIQPPQTEQSIVYATDAEKLAYYGVTPHSVHERLKELQGTEYIYDISSGGESVPIIITPNESSGGLLANTIRNNDGLDIPLEYLVTESRSQDYKFLTNDDDGAYVGIDVSNATDRECKAIIDYVRQRDETADFSGTYFSSREMIGELSVILIVSVLMLYLILAAQFESLLQPVIILTEVVIDVAAVLLLLFIMGESVNVMSMIGMVVMCGIIINDSILKIDTINRERRRGASLMKAICVASRLRLRPILMTSLTTILAIAPLLQRGDMGSALQFPLSLTIIIGMTVGTFVSLYFVPLVYYIIEKSRLKD